MRSQEDRVVVAGAGPVGMCVATMLVRHGIPVVVLEAQAQPSLEWRASTFHAPTVELLDELEVVEDMKAMGLIADRYQYRDRCTGVVAEFGFDLLKHDTRHPYRLQVAQQHLVYLLYDRLKDSDLAEIHLRSPVVDTRQNETSATAIVQTPTGRRELAGRFLLGADGARSAVRTSLGSAFEGMTYEDRFFIVSTPVEFDRYIPDLAPVNYVSDPDEYSFLLHTKEGWRALFPIPPEESDDEANDPGRVQARLRGIIPYDRSFPVLDQRVYAVHQRVAERFRGGRIVLLGDAAHINSPFGGMGLNSGLHDAFDVGKRLVRTWHRDWPIIDRELDTYAQRRRQVAINYVRVITHRNTQMIAEQDPQVRARNHAELAAIAQDPERAREWLLKTSMLTAVRQQGIGGGPDAPSE